MSFLWVIPYLIAVFCAAFYGFLSGYKKGRRELEPHMKDLHRMEDVLREWYDAKEKYDPVDDPLWKFCLEWFARERELQRTL